MALRGRWLNLASTGGLFALLVGAVGCWGLGIASAMLVLSDANPVVVALTLAAIGAVLYYALIELAYPRTVLYRVGAEPLDRDDWPELSPVVERLASRADVPVPDLYVVDAPGPVAFSVGYRPSSAAICVSSRLLRATDRAALEAILAHELAHVANRDQALVTVLGVPMHAALFALDEFAPTDATVRALPAMALRAIGRALLTAVGLVLLGLATVPRLTLFGLAFLAILTFGVGLGGILSGLWMGLVALALVVVVPILVVGTIGILPFALASRHRELLADREAARLTGDPLALVRALRTIDTSAHRIPEWASADPRLVGLLVHVPDDGSPYHPPLERRIERLVAQSTAE